MSMKIPIQKRPQTQTVKNKSTLPDNMERCSFNFRHFKTRCISQNDFNNHYKDESHFLGVISSFLDTILPTISDLTTTELMSGGRLSQQFHFHRVHCDKYDRIKSILEAYNFSSEQIEQILDGGNIFQFTGNIKGHDVESRVICEYNKGVIYILFFDTNHHLYIDRSKTGESLRFTYCPFESGNKCYNAYNCFAKSFLDEEKMNETYGYSYP